MDALECIKTRTCIRRYKQDLIKDEDIKDILNAAIQAPSAGNTQDWEFIVVKELDTKRSLTEASYGQTFIYQAPVVIVVCSDLERISSAYGTRGANLYSVQDTAAAIQNIMLSAWSKGIGSCWIGAFNEEKVREILILPSHIRPLAIITLGYPDEKPKKPDRMDLDRVVHRERY